MLRRGLRAQHLALLEKLQEQQPSVNIEPQVKPQWWNSRQLLQREVDPSVGGSLAAKLQQTRPPVFRELGQGNPQRSTCRATCAFAKAALIAEACCRMRVSWLCRAE